MSRFDTPAPAGATGGVTLSSSGPVDLVPPTVRQMTEEEIATIADQVGDDVNALLNKEPDRGQLLSFIRLSVIKRLTESNARA